MESIDPNFEIILLASDSSSRISSMSTVVHSSEEDLGEG